MTYETTFIAVTKEEARAIVRSSLEEAQAVQAKHSHDWGNAISLAEAHISLLRELTGDEKISVTVKGDIVYDRDLGFSAISISVAATVLLAA